MRGEVAINARPVAPMARAPEWVRNRFSPPSRLRRQESGWTFAGPKVRARAARVERRNPQDVLAGSRSLGVAEIPGISAPFAVNSFIGPAGEIVQPQVMHERVRTGGCQDSARNGLLCS